MNAPASTIGRMAPALGAALVACLFLAAVTWNKNLVVLRVPGGDPLVVYADGDCESRMQRAAIVAAHPGTFVRAHVFENYPRGTVPHTTAPMDYLIAALGVFVRPLDVAGAWASPIAGLACALFVWWWARRLDLRPRWPSVLLFCLSPALTHAFAFGRPDHQSLLVALTTAALACGWAFARTGGTRWAWCAGAAWGLALWVSWFEPLVLLAADAIARTLLLRGKAWAPPWRRAMVLAAVIALAAWCLEGCRNPWPTEEVRALFPRWAAMLGELQPAHAATMFGWTGWLLAPAPALLIWDYWKRRDPLAMMALALLAVVVALTGWQARWSPWLASVFCLALPWVLRPLGRRWVIWVVFVASLWPVARAWETRLFPSPAEAEKRREKIVEAAYLGQVAEALRAGPEGGVLAPWWISPALARRSDRPMVAGTSHQSLPGTADTARFFLCVNDAEALRILRGRGVRQVVSDAPERVVPTSAALLGAAPAENALAFRLARGERVPEWLEPEFANAFFRVYKVKDE